MNPDPAPATSMLAVRLLARTAEALLAETGLAAEEAATVAFRRGVAALSGREPLPPSGDAELDELLAAVLDLDAAATLNGWRVLDRQRHYEQIEPSVGRLAEENAALRARLIGTRHIETVDLAAAAQRLFRSRRQPL